MPGRSPTPRCRPDTSHSHTPTAKTTTMKSAKAPAGTDGSSQHWGSATSVPLVPGATRMAPAPKPKARRWAGWRQRNPAGGGGGGGGGGREEGAEGGGGRRE